MSLFTGFAIVAFALALLGLFAMTRYSLTQRHREIFIRHAIGASFSQMIKAILVRVASVQLVASLVGVLMSIAVASALQHLLFGVTSTDWQTWLVVVSTFLLCVLVLTFGSSLQVIRQHVQSKVG
jgi:putative ABC transport system permease protein